MKQPLLGRRIRLEQGRAVCTIAPAFVMASMTGRTQDVDPALLLRRFHGPCWARAPVFGREAMSWYRLAPGLSRCRVVGTPVKHPERLPQDRVADEKPSWWQGARVYIAPTAAPDGILGASVALSASQAAWEKAEGVFASEAPALDAEYAPETVKTEGWQATQGAWKALFPPMTVLLCLLHAFLTIRDRATTTLRAAFAQGQKRVWEAYHAPSQRAFSQRLRRLRAWAAPALPDGVMTRHTLDLGGKRDQCSQRSDPPEAYRTSPRVDRLRKCLDRAFFHAQYCHGMPDSAESRVRA